MACRAPVCGDRDDVELIDQTGPQERALEPASGLRHDAVRAELHPDLASADLRSTRWAPAMR